MPNLIITPAAVPEGLAFPPASWQILLNTVLAYARIDGGDDLTGVVVSVAEPAAADRGKLWAKQDSSSLRITGLYQFSSGAWTAMPISIPAGGTYPGSPQQGQLFFNTNVNAIEVYDGTQWTSNLFPKGTTSQRSENAPVDAVFFDTTIKRLLRMATQGWTTFDGGIGEIRMVDVADEADALTRNPGWSIFRAMDNRFPIGTAEDGSPQTDGGQQLEELKVRWSAQGRSATGGLREPSASFIASLTLQGVEARADGQAMAALTPIIDERTIDLTPPHHRVVFIRKDF